MDSNEQARRAVRVWMREVLEKKDWTAADWAKRAGTSPTNITRVLSPTSRIIPSAATIGKLAAVAGSQPKLSFSNQILSTATASLPLIPANVIAGFANVQVSKWWEWLVEKERTFTRVEIDRDPQGPAFVMLVETEDLETEGILAGDKILIEKNAEMKPGCYVAFFQDNSVGLGQWHRNVITRQNVPVNVTDVRVIGRITRIIRDV